MLKNIDIILPCYNPLIDWDKDVIKYFNEIKHKLGSDFQFKLIIVNDGSTSDLINVFTKIKDILQDEVSIIDYKTNQGKGFALREGIKHSSSELIIYTDIDFPYNFESFKNILLQLSKNNCDIVIGVRDENYYKNLPFNRVIISKILRFFLKIFLNLKVTDTQCGLKGFNKTGKDIFMKTEINRYLFDMEFIFLASKMKSIRIKSDYVNLREGIVMSEMNLKVLFQEMNNFFKVIFK